MKTKEWILTVLYGNNYRKTVKNEFFSFERSSPKDRKWKLQLWYAALILLLINVAMGLWLSGPIIMMIYFTCWAYEVTLALVICIIVLSKDPSINKKVEKLALIHVLSEVATCFNIIVVMVYWPFLHREALKHFSQQPVHPQWKCFHMYLIHSFPAIANVMILQTTNIRFASRHWIAFIPVTLAYSAVNYAGTLYQG